jgi:hypothetical protein
MSCAVAAAAPLSGAYSTFGIAWQMAQEAFSSDVESRGPPENPMAKLDRSANQVITLNMMTISLICPFMHLSPL